MESAMATRLRPGVKRLISTATALNLINLGIVFLKEKTLEKLLETGTIPMGAFVIGICIWASLTVIALRRCSSGAAILAVMIISSFNVGIISVTVTHLAATEPHMVAVDAGGEALRASATAAVGTRVSGLVVIGSEPVGKVSYQIVGLPTEQVTDGLGQFEFRTVSGVTDVAVLLGKTRHTFRLEIPLSAREVKAVLDLQSGQASLIPSTFR
jgi:hypothetical protein